MKEILRRHKPRRKLLIRKSLAVLPIGLRSIRDAHSGITKKKIVPVIYIYPWKRLSGRQILVTIFR